MPDLRRPETTPRCGEQQLWQVRVRAFDSRTRHSPQSTPEGCLTVGHVVLPSVGSRGRVVRWSSSIVRRPRFFFLPCEPPLAAYKSSRASPLCPLNSQSLPLQHTARPNPSSSSSQRTEHRRSPSAARPQLD
ncbi:hypothetical protein PVAP13_8KG051351 [Panicum virgatum]|uniref:Uncharacterized protein n=1 Tax=Panicum virgatum TaxID=38727 RepID=A0A8T0PPN4_PANVG|nr:hypothetical protein PVAP13_8KG051351 [Panicum virgatum]